MRRPLPRRCALPLLALLLVLAGCKRAHRPPKEAGLSEDAVVRLVRPDVADKAGWARDVRDAVVRTGLPPTTEHVCQVLAVIEQESGYEADPAVPGLGRIVKGQLDELFGKLGPVAGPVRRALLDHVGPGSTDTFEARLGRLRTEAEADRLYREIVAFHRARHPALSRVLDVVRPRLEEQMNPITTAGSMQVSVGWAIEHGEADGLRPEEVRELLYTRRGGVLYGTARLLGYEAGYDRPIFRFADYNAGFFASRNAAFQMRLSRVTGIALVSDGDLLIYGEDGEPLDRDSNTLRALLVYRAAHAPDLSERQVRRDVRYEKERRFEETETYARVNRTYQQMTKDEPDYAWMPKVTLQSPKMKEGRTTRWFAESVQRRYEACLARGR